MGYDVPYTFANGWISYTDSMGRVRIYKRGEIRTLSGNEVRELIDVLLMVIPWQGFRIDNEEVMKAI